MPKLVWLTTPMSLAPSHIGRRNGERGLTMQEMLIVVAVFIILALIFFLASNQVLVKTRTTRVKQDQKTLSNALNAYMGMNSEYPPTGHGLSRLVVARLMTDIPRDPFSKSGDEHYVYYTFKSRDSAQPYFLIISPGPDGDVDFDPSENVAGIQTGVGGQGSFLSSIPDFTENLYLLHYDPTNGVVSDGDIIEFR